MYTTVTSRMISITEEIERHLLFLRRIPMSNFNVQIFCKNLWCPLGKSHSHLSPQSHTSPYIKMQQFVCSVGSGEYESLRDPTEISSSANGLRHEDRTVRTWVQCWGGISGFYCICSQFSLKATELPPVYLTQLMNGEKTLHKSLWHHQPGGFFFWYT